MGKVSLLGRHWLVGLLKLVMRGADVPSAERALCLMKFVLYLDVYRRVKLPWFIWSRYARRLERRRGRASCVWQWPR